MDKYKRKQVISIQKKGFILCKKLAKDSVNFVSIFFSFI